VRFLRLDLPSFDVDVGVVGLLFTACSPRPVELELALDDLSAVAYDKWDNILRGV
jgi:hypothetical protein